LHHFIRPPEQRRRDRQPKRLGDLEVITSSEWLGCSIGKSAGFAPRRIRSTK
jgi:hypothetical protein